MILCEKKSLKKLIKIDEPLSSFQKGYSYNEMMKAAGKYKEHQL